jgi:twitching motility protein PilI
MHIRSLTEMHAEQDALATPDRQERRQALREFQRQLVERTQLARSGSSSEQMRLAVQAGDQRLLLDVAHTAEVIAYESVKRVPHTCAWFLGLINCRGRLMGVIDLSGFLGRPVKPSQDSDRLLILSDSLAVPCALRVSRVTGLVSLSGFTLQPQPADESSWVRSFFVDRESRSWRLLDLPLLMEDPAFLDVVAR